MATPCPCGCGRSINWLLKRTAERGVFVDSLTSVPSRMAELVRESDRESATQLNGFADMGRSLSSSLIDGAHQEPWASPPNGKILGDWEAAALKLRRGLNTMDPTWVLQNPLVRNRVTGKGGPRTPRQLAPVRSTPTANQGGVVYRNRHSGQMQILENVLNKKNVPFDRSDDGLVVDRKYEVVVDTLIADRFGSW